MSIISHGLLSNTNIRIQTGEKNAGDPHLPPALCKFLLEKGGILKSCPTVLTSEGLGEMFECDSADKCTEKIPLVLMGG